MTASAAKGQPVVLRSAAGDLGCDALRERVRARKKRVVPGAELDEPGAGSDALTLHLGWGGEILGADEVRGGLLLPGDMAGWLRERRDGLARETVKRLLGRDLVAVLEKERTPGSSRDRRQRCRRRPAATTVLAQSR